MLRKERKHQKAKILKREQRLKKQNNVQDSFSLKKIVDAAKSASYTDAIEPFDFKLNYDLED